MVLEKIDKIINRMNKYTKNSCYRLKTRYEGRGMVNKCDDHRGALIFTRF